MKEHNTLSLVAATIAVTALIASFWRPQAEVSAVSPTAAEAECSTGRTIQVSGSATVNVTPDRVMITLGVQTNGTSPDVVHADNVREIQKVINAIKGLGVDAKDIATDFYIVEPVYADYNALDIKGYRVNNTISITLRDITLVDDVILTALNNGANQVQNIEFYTSEMRKYRDQARELATKAAGEKAQALSGAAGAQVGCVLTVSENIWSQYYGSWSGGRNTAMWTQNVIQNTGGSEIPMLDDSPISLGQIAVQAQVSLSYSLK